MPYIAVKTLLRIAFGAALSFAGLAGVSFFSAALVLVAAALLAFWLVRHPTEIRQAYAARRSKGEKYIRESGKPWSKLPNPNIIGGLLLLVGAVCLWAVFASPTAPVRGYLRQVLYSILGPQGSMVVAGMAAAVFLSAAAEHFLGSHWSHGA